MKRVFILVITLLTFFLYLPINSMAARSGDYGMADVWNETGMVYDVNGRGAILYAKQSTDSDQLGLFYNGYTVSADVYNEKWAHVNVGLLGETRYVGFMSLDELILYTTLPDTSIPKLPIISQFGSLTGDGDVSLLSKPNTHSESYGKYMYGTVGQIVGECDDWYYMFLLGTPGFINKNNVKLLNEPDTYVTDVTIIPYPTIGNVWFDPANEEIPFINPGIAGGSSNVWKTAEQMELGLDKLDLIANLEQWFQVSLGSTQYYVESKYFLDRRI